MDALPPGSPAERRPMRARLGGPAVVVALILCFVGMGWAFTLNTTPELPAGTEVEGVEPVFGAAAVPGQTPVKVDLQVGYTGEISLIDGQNNEINLPADEVDYEPAQAVLSFSPGPGKTITRFTKGLYKAQVVYWPVTNSTDRKIFQWSFTVV